MSKTHNATGGNADAPSTASTMAVMGQQLTDENAHLRALLAQREAEIEALRVAARRVARVWTWSDPETWDSEEWDNAHDDLVAALSDNPESPALTDKEA